MLLATEVQPMRKLVIGSNSFSGASYVASLLEAGEDVVGVSRSAEPHSCYLPYKAVKTGNFEFHKMDLNGDLSKLTSLISREKFQTIVNFAAQSMVAESWEFPDHWFQTNVVATVNLHNFLRGCDFLENYVHVSTPEVYGNCEGFVMESQTFNPSTPYAVSRAAADMSLRTFFNQYKFPVMTTRAANVYGPGQRLYRIIPRTIIAILSGEPLELHGAGASVRSFIHMDDVNAATNMIIAKGTPGESYHISTNEMISIRELVKKICDLMNADFDAHVTVVGERPGKDSAYKLSSEKLRSSTGWEPAVSIDEGLKDCVEWALQNKDLLLQEPLKYEHKP